MDFPAGYHKEQGLKYSPLKALISPRPIGWISTRSADKQDNLAPYSFFNAVSEQPAMVMFVSAPDARAGRHGKEKDSLTNILETREFAVNMTSEAQLDQMVASARPLDVHIDEFDATGLAKRQAKMIDVPLVDGAPAHLECRYYDHITLPEHTGGGRCVMIIGEVVHLHIDDKYVKDGRVDVTAFRPASRLGYKDYALITEVIERQP